MLPRTTVFRQLLFRARRQRRHPQTGRRHTAREWGVRELTVGPGVPVNGHPGSVRLGVERARGGVRLVRVDGHGRVAVRLKEGAPGLIGLVPVARGGSVVPVYKNDGARRQCGGRQVPAPRQLVAALRSQRR